MGTKYDQFIQLPKNEQEETTLQARKYAKAMKAPLIFCSSSSAVNIQNIFKIVLSKAFDLKCKIPIVQEVGAPIVEY